MRSERERLLDILEAIERIEKYAAKGSMLFQRTSLSKTGWLIILQ